MCAETVAMNVAIASAVTLLSCVEEEICPVDAEWFWVLLIAVCGVSFLFGRWRGIRDFEKAMEEANKRNKCEGS